MSKGNSAPSLRHDHGRQAPPEGISQFKKTVGPHAGDIRKNNATAMQFCENFLIYPGMLKACTPSITTSE